MRRRKAIAFAVLAFSLAACATGRPDPRAGGPGVAARSVTWRDAGDELSSVMRALLPQLARAGVAPQDTEVRGFLTTGGRITHRVRVPADTCATFIAIASGGVHDMDAAIYSPEGSLLAADAQPDAHPTVQLCTGTDAGEFYYALHVYEGAGSFLMLPFFGNRHSIEAVSRQLGNNPAVARLDNTTNDPADRVAAFREGVRRRGFEPVDQPMRVPLIADQQVRVALPVLPGRCYTAAGFSVAGVDNLDLRVLDDEGGEVARDESPGGDAALQFCAERSAQFAAELHGMQEGDALLTIFQADSGILGGPESLWLGERPVARPSLTPLDEALQAAADRAAEDGFHRRRTLGTQRLLPGQAVREALELPARRCTRIHAVGGPGVRTLRLFAANREGSRLGSAQGTAQSTYLHVCSSASQSVELSLHAAAGSGEVALLTFDAPLSQTSVVQGSDVLSARYHQASAEARDAGYKPHPLFVAGPQRVAVAAHRSAPLEVDAPEAHCVRAFVLSPDPAVRAELMHGGKALASMKANSETVHLCSTGTEPFGSLDLEVEAGDAASNAWLMVLIK